MAKVLIINEGYSNNLGDQAILGSTVEYYKDLGFETDFLYLSKPSMSHLPKYDYLNKTVLLAPSKKPLNKLKAFFYLFYWYWKNRKSIVNKLTCKRYDLISIGGGQLINSSNTGLPSQFAIALYWLTKLIKQKSPHSKIIFFAIGVAKSFNFLERRLFQRALNSASGIWVRDSFSKDTLQVLFSKDSVLMPDIAFYRGRENSSMVSEKENIALVGIANYDEVVAKYRPEISKDEYYTSILSQIDFYKAKGVVVYLFYTTKLDVHELWSFNRFLNKNNKEEIEVCEIQNLSDLIGLIKKSKYIFSGRMHALILGLKYQCEVTSYLVSQKLLSFDEAYVQRKTDIGELNEEIIDRLRNIENFNRDI